MLFFFLWPSPGRANTAWRPWVSRILFSSWHFGLVLVALVEAVTVRAARPPDLDLLDFDKKPMLKVNDRTIALTFTPDGKYLVSSTASGQAIVWNVSTRRVHRKLDLTDGRSEQRWGGTVAILLDKRTLVSLGYTRRSADDGIGCTDTTFLRYWDIKTWRCRKTELFTGRSSVSALSPDGKLAAFGGVPASYGGPILGDPPPDDTIRIWKIDKREDRLRLKGEKGSGGSFLSFSPDGKLLASAYGWGVRVWDITSGKSLAVMNPKNPDGSPETVATFSPDSKVLASGGYDRQVYLWNVATGRKQGILPTKNSEVCALAFSPDGKLMAIGGQQCVEFWRLKGAELVDRYYYTYGEQEFVRVLAFSPDGRLVAAGGDDKRVRIIEVPGGK
jgi:WD40 repeat protein